MNAPSAAHSSWVHAGCDDGCPTMSWYCCWEANVKIMYFTVCVLPATSTRSVPFIQTSEPVPPDRTPVLGPRVCATSLACVHQLAELPGRAGGGVGHLDAE